MFEFLKYNRDKEKTKANEKKLLRKYGKCRELNKSIKLLIVTDTHGYLQYKQESIDKLKNIDQYDLCCCLGDITYSDYEIILQYVPREKILALLGNHDGFETLNHFSLTDINGKIITKNGIRFGGIQGSYKYKPTAFPSFTQQESRDFLNKLGEVDVLLSHSAPLIDNAIVNIVHRGLVGITEYLYKNHVPYNIHGHNHNNSDSYLKNGTHVIEKYFVEELILQLDN